MKRSFAFATMLAAALTLGGVPAHAANKGLSGIWKITFYAGPKGVAQPALCIRFAQTNNIAGYTKYSGTWVSTTSLSLAGQWIQNGDDVMWYGASGKVSFFSVGDLLTEKKIGGSGYAQFKNNNNATQGAGTWTGQKSPNCVPG